MIIFRDFYPFHMPLCGICCHFPRGLLSILFGRQIKSLRRGYILVFCSWCAFFWDILGQPELFLGCCRFPILGGCRHHFSVLLQPFGAVLHRIFSSITQFYCRTIFQRKPPHYLSLLGGTWKGIEGIEARTSHCEFSSLPLAMASDPQHHFER